MWVFLLLHLTLCLGQCLIESYCTVWLKMIAEWLLNLFTHYDSRVPAFGRQGWQHFGLTVNQCFATNADKAEMGTNLIIVSHIKCVGELDSGAPDFTDLIFVFVLCPSLPVINYTASFYWERVQWPYLSFQGKKVTKDDSDPHWVCSPVFPACH